MAFKIFATLLFLILPISTMAEEADYLFVSFDYRYTNGSISNMSAEQRVMDASQVSQFPGEFVLILKDGSEVISQVNFSIRLQPEIEAYDPEQGGSYATSDVISKTVGISIPVSLVSDNASISIEKGGQILASQKLSELNLEILSAKESHISVSRESITYPPLPPLKGSSLFLPLIIGILGLLVIGLIIWFLMRKKGSARYAPPNAMPPTSPAPENTPPPA